MMKNKIAYVFVIGLFFGNQLFGMESLGLEVSPEEEAAALCRSQDAFDSMVAGGVFVNEVLMFLEKDDEILACRLISKAVDRGIREYYRDHEDQRIKSIYLTPEKIENERLLQQGLSFVSEYFQGIRVSCRGRVFKKLLLDDDLDLIKPKLVGISAKFCLSITDNDTLLELAIEPEQLEKIRELTEISLNFADCEEIEDTGLLKIANLLAGLHKLKKVSLSFRDLFMVTKYGCGSIVKSLSRDEPFQSVDIDFSHLGRVCVDAFIEILPVIENAVKVSLSFGSWELDKNVIAAEGIAHTIKSNKYLQKLCVYLCNCQILSDCDLWPIEEALNDKDELYIYIRSTTDICARINS